MLIYVLILILFIFAFIIFYCPVLYQHFVFKRTENNFIQELNLLNDFYKNKLIVVTEKLGEGPSQNSDVKFAQAHKNQIFAINSILDLLDECEE